MKFSVLMSIYINEKSIYLNRAMQSIWDEQIVKPDEIVLVQDGPLTDELYLTINKWKEKLGSLFILVILKKNVGLGDALNEGMKYCSYELISRMDTDDISLPERFKKQLEIFEEKDIDICSAFISEFQDDEREIISYRKIPEKHNDIVKYSKKRSPINHIPVMFKKSVVIKAGGYMKMMWFEDYYLWVRLIINNAKFYNIQEPLANIRSGYNQLERRRGLKYALSEFYLQKKFLKLGFINPYEFLRNISIRFFTRMMPSIFVKLIYKILRK
jgi:glycosyltransferase involved in cell wall biosynthesis